MAERFQCVAEVACPLLRGEGLAPTEGNFLVSLRSALFATALAVALPTAAGATTVNLDGLRLRLGNGIQASAPGFGSLGPVTLNWAPFGDPRDLLYWPDGYSGRAAAYCDASSGCALDLTVAGALNAVTLNSFFLGGFPNTDRSIAYSVLDLATSATVVSGTPNVSGTTGLVVSVGATSAAGFRILFGPDGSNGGINDISFTGIVGDPIGVPAPAALALFGLGLLGLAAARRRG